MKHVVFAHRKLSFGGGERVLLEQVAALAGLPVKVTVLFRKEPGKRDIEPELRRRNPNVAEVRHLPGALGAFRWLRQARPDLLVLCNHKGVQRALPWLARLGSRIPTVVTLHEHYERHLRKYRGIREVTDRWICTYDFTAAVRACLGPAPCSIIHPLYPRPEATAASPEARRAARRALGLPEAGTLVGYVGQIDGRKDPVSVLRFAEALDAALPGGTGLLFAGREEAATAQSLDAAVAGSTLRGRVRRLGPLQDLSDAFTALDLYVMTSRNEGFFPIALIEALERGVPVLAPTVGGIGTVLRDGEGGFLIRKPDDRRSPEATALGAVAARLAPLMADPAAWQVQRDLAHTFGTALTRGYDAAAAFREAVTTWL
ncbi:MAG TPA: glycosyltransferase family 4 protein [Holophagaceae bacterium]